MVLDLARNRCTVVPKIREGIVGLEQLSLEQLAVGFREKTLSVKELINHAVTNHDKADLNAYVTWEGEQARSAADHLDGLISYGYDTGPLMGIPCSVKDLYGVPGMPVYAGTNTPFEESWSQAGPVVRCVMEQCGIIMGKTHTVELAFGGIGINDHWPTPQNPWAGGGRIPGGSSSGAGVSLCEGSARIALGTDTAGSVRIPASVTGNVGLKLTKDRWLTRQIVPLSSSFDTPGILCRTVEDIRYAFMAMDPMSDAIREDLSLSGLHIGVLEGLATEDVDTDIANLVSDALRKIETQGAQLQQAQIRNDRASVDLFRQGGLAASELAAFLNAHYPERIAKLAPIVRNRVDAANGLSAVDYLRRKSEFDRMASETVADMEPYDLLACATVAISPPELAKLSDPEAYAKANMMVLRNTALANLLGLCSITLPIGLDRNGMPAGLMLMGRPYDEERLITAALAIEKTIGTGAQLLGAPR